MCILWQSTNQNRTKNGQKPIKTVQTFILSLLKAFRRSFIATLSTHQQTRSLLCALPIKMKRIEQRKKNCFDETARVEYPKIDSEAKIQLQINKRSTRIVIESTDNPSMYFSRWTSSNIVHFIMYYSQRRCLRDDLGNLWNVPHHGDWNVNASRCWLSSVMEKEITVLVKIKDTLEVIYVKISSKSPTASQLIASLCAATQFFCLLQISAEGIWKRLDTNTK